MNTYVLDILIIIVVSLLITWWVAFYQTVTRVPGEYKTITEKISSIGNCTSYKTIQVCEEGKRCEWEKPMKWPVYSTVCEDGRAKTQEFIRQSCGKNCTKTFTEEVTTTHKLNP